jgi:hypothetical protein
MATAVTHMYRRTPDDQDPTGRQPPRHPSNGDDTDGNHPRKKGMSQLIAVLLIVVLVLVLWAGFFSLACPGSSMNGQPVGELPYSTFYQQVMNGNVKNATFQGQDITGETPFR